MSLPVLKTPSYTLTVPSTNKVVKYRPFLVREEKIMLLVKESKDPKEMLNAMKDVIKSCTFDVLDPERLSVFDIEYIFLQIRSKSVGEIIEIGMRCINKIPKPTEEGFSDEMIECGGKIDFTIDISKINVTIPDNHTNIVMVTEDVGITFRYPSLDTVLLIEDGRDEFEVLIDLIDNIFDKDNVYDAKDSSREQLTVFIDSLTKKQYQKILNDFFKTMPFVEHTENFKCPKCGNKGSYNFRGISDFF